MRPYAMIGLAQLPPALLELPLPDLALRLAEDLRDVDVTACLEGEAKSRGAALVLEELQQAEASRRLGCAAVVIARRIGEALGPGTPGKPAKGETKVLPEIEKRTLRMEYRACAEPTAAEFAEWVQTAPLLSRGALARYGRKLRKLRDRESGEPLAPPSGDSPEEQPEEGPGEVEHSHRAKVLLAMLEPVAEEAQQLPEVAQREALRLIEHLRDLLESLDPDAEEGA